ncbi:MAG: tetratricopeptide repeat protein [Pseudomonadota bacterium]
MDNKSILLIDDHNRSTQDLEKIIQASGYKNHIRANGADKAWMMMKTQPVDCVVCAYEMQEMSGLALLKIVRREDDFSDIPFFLTDPAFTKIKVIKAGQSGVTGLFVIPFDEKAVSSKICSALNKDEAPVIKQTRQIFEQGLDLIEKKEYDKAIEVFTALIEQRENPEYYFNIGYIKASQRKHFEAIEAFSMATRLDNLFAKAYEEIGRVYKLMGDRAKSEEFMHKAAEIYMDTDKLGPAEDVLNELLESGTDSLNVFNTLGVLYRKKGDTAVALVQYKKALKVHPDEPYIYYNIGRLYLDMKETEQAKDYFRQALGKDPGFDEAKQVIKAIDLGLV